MEEEKKVEEKKVEEKKGTSVVLIIVLIVAFVLCFFAGIYVNQNFMNKKDDSAESKEKKDNKKEETTVKLSEQEVKNNIKDIDFIISYFNKYQSVNYPLNITSLPNQEILKSALLKISEGKTTAVQSFTKEEMESAITSIYGSDIKFEHQDIKCFLDDGPLYTFDGTKYDDFLDGHGHGGEGYYRSESYFVDATIDSEKGTIDVNEKILYGDFCSDICGPIMSYSDSANEDNILYTNDDDLKDFDEVYPQVKDKLPITTFHFEKDSKGNYALKSISVK